MTTVNRRVILLPWHSRGRRRPRSPWTPNTVAMLPQVITDSPGRLGFRRSRRSPPHCGTLALNPIDFTPAVLHQFVIVSHRLAKGLVRHERMLHVEEVLDSLHRGL